MRNLFGSATEYGGIAAFQAHNAFSSLSGSEQQIVDAALVFGMAARAFADIDGFDVWRDEIEDT